MMEREQGSKVDKQSTFKIVKELPFDTKEIIFKRDDFEIYLLRPSSLSKRFKEYDIKKNFQIWLRENERNFRPNHLRVLIDLNLRVRSRPDLKKQLLTAFDSIFYEKDPEIELTELEKEHFEHFLNPLTAIGYLSQLFIIEQEYGYHKESKYDPPTLFFQGWVREFIDSPKEIDNLCMSVAKGQEPQAKYTNKENRKSKTYVKQLKPLWYLGNDEQPKPHLE